MKSRRAEAGARSGTQQAGATRRAGPLARLQSPLVRYALFQIPGTTLIAILLLIAVRYADISAGLAIALFAMWVAKDAALYPSLRIAYEAAPAHGAGTLVGAAGVSVGALAPEGWVRVGPERWRARLIGDAQSLAAGSPVRVRDIEGLTLVVESDAAPEAEDAPGT